MTSGSFLSVAAVATILTGVAIVAALTAFVFDTVGWPERRATVLFFLCLAAIWLVACGVVVLIRSTT